MSIHLSKQAIFSSCLVRKHSHYWYSNNNQRYFLDKLGHDLLLKTQRDWTILTHQKASYLGASVLLHHYDWNILSTFQHVYPEINWISSRSTLPRSHWTVSSNVITFLNNAGLSLRLSTIRDWSRVTNKEMIERQGGGSLLFYHGGSFVSLLDSVYPELKFRRLFTKMKNFFSSKTRERCHVDAATTVMPCLVGVSTQSDWKNVVHRRSLLTHVTPSLYHRYSSSFELVSSVYPELDNVVWYGALTTNNPSTTTCLDTTTNTNERRKLLFLLEEIARASSLLTKADWRLYAPSRSGLGLDLIKNHGSLSKIAEEIYPELCWSPFDLNSVYPKFWKISELENKFLGQVISKYELKTITDWYRTSNVQISKVSSRVLPRKVLVDMLQSFFPEEEWHHDQLSRLNKKSSQRWLFLTLRRLFGAGTLVLEDFRLTHTKRDSGVPLELDVFIPDKNLGFEYQGEQHFVEIPKAGFGSLQEKKKRDWEKRELCERFGICLVVVPWSWDFEMESLIMMIQQQQQKQQHQKQQESSFFQQF